MRSEAESISDPTFPAAYDIAWAVLPALAIVLAIVAVVGILRAASLSGGLRLLWLAIALAIPVLGPAAWLIARYTRPRASLL